MRVWVLKRKNLKKKKKKTLKASELESQGRHRAWTLSCVPSPGVFRIHCDLGPEFCLFLSSPRVGTFLFCFQCLFLLLREPWQAPIAVAVGQKECSRAAEMGGDSGWLIPQQERTVLPPPHPCHSVKEPRGATSPGLRSPTSRVTCPVPLLPSCCVSRGPAWSFRQTARRGRGGRPPLEEQAPQVWVPVSVPGAWQRGAASL